MNEPDTTKKPDEQELDAAQAEEVGGGGDLCSAEELVSVSGALTQTYENVVAFASHVIERVAGEENN